MSLIPHKATISKPKALTLGELAKKTNTKVLGDPSVQISGVGTLVNAKPGEITFLASPKYRQFLESTQASAVIVTSNEASVCKVAALISEDPKLVFAQILHLLYPNQVVESLVHPTAVIGKDCNIHPLTHIGPHCVIGSRVTIGANVIVQAGCYIGDDCCIGDGTVFYPHATIYHGCKIGKDCTIHSGVVIGSDGFGFAKDKNKWLKIPQVGSVKIGDRVDVGANTTIDRGAIEDTEIGNDVILDNLIQIGHNVKVGMGSAIAACTGIAGSTTVGKDCLIGGGSSINGHISITDGVHLVGSSNVAQSITEPGAYASAVTVNTIKAWKRNLLRFHQLDNLAVRLREIEKKLAAQEEA
jgi:UDP-3-O-[3-hydroxymyristoyl] glucosamine N-acyltransferase